MNKNLYIGHSYLIFHSFIHNTFICTSFHHKEKKSCDYLATRSKCRRQSNPQNLCGYLSKRNTIRTQSGLQTGSREIIHIHIIKNMKNDTQSVIFNPVKICKICKNTKMVQGNVEVSQTDLGLLFYWKQRSFWSCYTLLLVFCICSLKEEVQIHCAGGESGSHQ